MKTEVDSSAFPRGGGFTEGLTKLEFFSVMLMQSFLKDNDTNPADAARKAVWSAWELVAHLNKDELRCD